MKTSKLFGYEIYNSDFKDAISEALSLMDGRKTSQIITVNPEMINLSFVNENFAKLLNDAELLLPDGIGIKLALMIMGQKSNRIAGVDFAYNLLQQCEKNSVPVAFVGTTEEILNKAIAQIKTQMPDLKIVYTHNGFFENNEDIYEGLKNAAPSLVLVALGSPKQEFFIAEAKNKLKNGLLIGVGGSFDVWSGEIKRAPVIFQKLGLEWLYRTVTQPKRLKRIFPALPLFLIKVLKERLGV